MQISQSQTISNPVPRRYGANIQSFEKKQQGEKTPQIYQDNHIIKSSHNQVEENPRYKHPNSSVNETQKSNMIKPVQFVQPEPQNENIHDECISLDVYETLKLKYKDSVFKNKSLLEDISVLETQNTYLEKHVKYLKQIIFRFYCWILQEHTYPSR